MLKIFYALIKSGRAKFSEIISSLLCILIFLLATLYDIPVITSLISQMDNKIYDQILNMNWHPHPSNPKLVIVNIDEYSVQKEGRWPWPRDKMAALINKLKQNGVVTIGLDIVMSEAEINYALGLKKKLELLGPLTSPEQKQLMQTLETIAPKTDNDQIFAQTLLNQNVVLGFLFQHEQSVRKGALPAPLNFNNNESVLPDKSAFYSYEGYNGILKLFLDASGQAGFVTNLPGQDGILRHNMLLASYKNQLYPSLALKIAMNYLLADHVRLLFHKQKLYGLDLDGTFIPTNSHGQMLIPYWGKAGTQDYFSATDILNDRIAKSELEGSIAIIGSSMTLLSDLHDTPVAAMFPGVEVVGNIVQGIVSQQVIAQYDWHTAKALILIFVWGILFSFTLPFLGILGKLVITLIGVMLLWGTTLLFYVYKGLYIPPAVLINLTILQAIINYSYAYILERRQKQKINQLFGQYVPEHYVKELIEYPDKYNMEGQTLDMTVQFTDIRNFTDISENLDAIGVKHLLNTFFTPITEIIFKHHGTIDKYVGDMIVAFWGAPLADKNHAYNAISASLDVFQHLAEINSKLIENDLPQVNIGVGLASGLMNVGDMGSEFRRTYTVLGDTVNLASRLQDLTKFYQVNILVNDTARFKNDTFLWRAIDKVAVKGRKTALTIYQPLSILSEASSELLNEVDEFHAALKEYYLQNWHTAEQGFNALLLKYPHVYLYQLYIERVTNFKNNPPPPDWDGIYRHEHK